MHSSVVPQQIETIWRMKVMKFRYYPRNMHNVSTELQSINLGRRKGLWSSPFTVPTVQYGLRKRNWCPARSPVGSVHAQRAPKKEHVLAVLEYGTEAMWSHQLFSFQLHCVTLFSPEQAGTALHRYLHDLRDLIVGRIPIARLWLACTVN